MTPTVSGEPLPNPITAAESLCDSVPVLIGLAACTGTTAGSLHVAPSSSEMLYSTSLTFGHAIHSRSVESLAIVTVHAPPRNAGEAVLEVFAIVTTPPICVYEPVAAL
jgi:hypothetical protein